jgi:hypothetical protein
MKFKVFLLGLSTLTLGSCIDSDYDLSDIDTTSEFKVEDLTLPVNIDAIKLSDIFNVKEDSKVQVVNIDGKEYYAIVSEGSFCPNPVKVATFTAAAPSINSTSEILFPGAEAKGKGAAQSLTFSIQRDEQPFIYHFSGIDDAVHSAKSVLTKDTYMKISVDMSALASNTQNITIKDLKLSLPKGLTATTDKGSYDKNSGLLTIPELPLSNGKGDITLDITGLDFLANGAAIDYNAHALTMNSAIVVESGYITANLKENGSEPNSTTLFIHYDFSPITATAFSGEVQYDVKGINIDPIRLTDIPKFLSQEGTEIFLTNPQIYLKMHNMVADSKLRFSTGLRFTANRANAQSLTFTPDEEVYVGYANGSGPYNFVLSPTNPASPLEGYSANLKHVSFSSLSDLLGGASGIPSSINVEAVNPQVPLQSVENFRLGTEYASQKDSYEFFAPLSLKTGSMIIYSDTYDGWNDEDVDAITINKLTVTANVTSELPLEADVIAYPIDKEGNVINNVEIQGGKLPADADNYELTLSSTGVITHLDGVRIEARVLSGDNNALAPAQTITLRNIKAKVSGSYTKKF